MKLSKDMENYAASSEQEALAILRELVVIPAPSHHEDQRAAFIKKWFEDNGISDVSIDPALNVVCRYNVTDDNDLVMFMAHTDTVFPAETKLEITERDGKWYCPAIGDDTAQLVNLMIAARYFVQNKIRAKTGILFVANSCEEGLGDLKGSRQLNRDYGNRLKAVISFDAPDIDYVMNTVIGSHRYRISLKTEGGHSFADFGNMNAIRYAASLIDTLYTVKVPVDGDSTTTYNVGTISGGQSVNSIAAACEFLYEYRSTSKKLLLQMENIFYKLIDTYREMGVDIEVSRVGERPCMGDVDPESQAALSKIVEDSVREIVGKEPRYMPGSGDANIPLDNGIPALQAGGVHTDGAHKLTEWIDPSSMLTGIRHEMNVMAHFFEL